MTNFTFTIPHSAFRISHSAFVVLLLVLACAPRPRPVPLKPLSMREAVGIVNANVHRIGGTLKASGVVDGRFSTEEGRSRAFHVDATLMFLAPRSLRFDLKKFGDRQILFGSNDEAYWIFTKDNEAYQCGRHGALEDLPPDVPVRPDQIVDALGLSLIDEAVAGLAGARLAPRVVEEHQQVLFLVTDDRDAVRITKEYWLDRYAPRLVRRVVFRDSDGVVEMESRLDDYRALSPDGPLLPHVMEASWPATKTHMRFRIRRWSLVPQVKADSVQFATPSACTSTGGLRSPRVGS